jgi:predicted metal-dependent enzyme (double-stranded beta helix superfamily)
MALDLSAFVSRCELASRAHDAQAQVAALLREVIERPGDLAEALSGHTNIENLEDLIVYRSETLTLLHGLLPPGFTAAPHNHNLWSVIAVYAGQEDNVFFEKDGPRLVETRRVSIMAPGVVSNSPDVIHSIHNPRGIELRAVHAYGGDLLATPRSSWDAESHEETSFDWRKVASE